METGEKACFEQKHFLLWSTSILRHVNRFTTNPNLIFQLIYYNESLFKNKRTV